MDVPGMVSTTISSMKTFNTQIDKDGQLSVILFWAEFHAPSSPGGQIDVMFSQLAMMHPGIKFAKISAENCLDICEQYRVSVVPTFLFLQGKHVLDTLEGANVAELAKRVDILGKSKSKASKTTMETTKDEPKNNALHDRLKKLIRASPVMVFMKGQPKSPQCGFSRQLVEIFDQAKIPFGSFDILSDPEVRAELKVLSNWPTYPQVYVRGEFVGGLDIMKDMIDEEPETSLMALLGLEDLLKPDASLHAQLRALTQSATVMVFMKGHPDEPQCGFSRKIVALLREQEVPFSTFDILSDPEVRAELKVLSNWPTYPQVYVRGEFVGGLDIIVEMAEDVSLAQEWELETTTSSKALPLDQLVRQAPVMVFIKGTRDVPECGFSRQLISILEEAKFDYTTFDVLSDPDVRSGLKTFSNWPTFPQMYIKGEFIGGLDIVRELHEEKELVDLKP